MNNLYDSLPIFGQNMACTWAGFTRSRERFTRHFHHTLAEWTETGRQSLPELHALQRRRLESMVEHARRDVRFYGDIPPPSQADDPVQAIEETLLSIPILEKDTYRDHFEEMIAGDVLSLKLRRAHTSGTTGSALPLTYTPHAIAEEYATVWRQRSARGIGLRDPHLTFGGQTIVPFAQSSPPFWRRNLIGRQTLFSVHHMTPRNLELYVEKIHKSRATYILSYPSSLHLVARAMLHMGRPLEPGRIKAIFTSSESLLAFQRASIEEAFGARVWDRYGTSEFAVSMTECEEGRLHVDMEYCIVEVEAEEENDEFVRGPLIVTGLSNDATPFLRYRIGDVGTRLKRPCSCGRAGDAFSDVDGRNEDYVMTPDGRLIGRLDHIFKEQGKIREAQILQDSKEAIEVVLVPAPDFDEAARMNLLREIRKRLGDDIHVDLRTVDVIPRERNGKFRAVKSSIGRMVA